MNYTEEAIKDLFKAHTTLSVTFTKKDGSLRKMNCTRDLGLVPDTDQPKGTGKPSKPGHLNVYELGVGWRSFNCDKVTEALPCGVANKPKPMIIVGDMGSGKTRRALTEASNRGSYVTITWKELRSEFGFSLLESKPNTVIVEMLTLAALADESERSFLKYIVSEDNLIINVRGKDLQTVPAPTFIFTVLAPTASNIPLTNSELRRFDVVEVNFKP